MRVYKDIVTFQVSVDNGMRLFAMEVVKALDDGNAPLFNNSQSRILDLIDILPETSSSKHFGNKDDLFLLFVRPC